LPHTNLLPDEITVAMGMLFNDDGVAVGLNQDDGRNTDWLDPRALYRCHSRPIRLNLRDGSRSETRGLDDTPRAT